MSGGATRSTIDLNTLSQEGVVSGDVTIQSPAEQTHRFSEEAKKSGHVRKIEWVALLAVLGLAVWMVYLYSQTTTPPEHQKIALQAIIGIGSALLGYVAGKKSS
jgi:hypothetical protein